jgi:hypothetical protein
VVERVVLEDGEETRYLHRVVVVEVKVELSFSRADRNQYRLPQLLRSQQEKLELRVL